ncbi:hypothetical protein [Streptomyces sp. SID3343]|uniref:hypothetical protein n=1 Tax=Streptomyces sp. SID3343 TaxID=2690260 RepID=UPI001369B5F4|nr:hypothetical protein [Streptomyces sp. SID3343]MYV98391.1 hypothetical protein [Streptomyces sp. SID3343]
MKADTGKVGSYTIVPLPQWCLEKAFTGWWYTRYASCDISERHVAIIDVTTQQPLGTMNFVQYAYTYSTDISSTWINQIEVKPVTQVGVTAEARAQGTATCAGACSTTSSDFPSQPVSLTKSGFGEGRFASTIPATGGVGSANTTWTRWFTGTTWTATNQVTITPPQRVRCDSMTRGTQFPGCVFPDYAPQFNVSSATNPNFAGHLRNALASGLPGGGWPNGTPLTRMMDEADGRRNGDRACPQAGNGGYPRPPGFSCDEYPFRSTWEGALTQTYLSPPNPNPPMPVVPGRTFSGCQIPQLGSGTGPQGWSACMIPAGENSSGGGLLTSFYRSNRVIELDHFYVYVY